MRDLSRLDGCWRRGWNAARDGVQRSACSMRAGTARRVKWLAGWWDYQIEGDKQGAAVSADRSAAFRGEIQKMYREACAKKERRMA